MKRRFIQVLLVIALVVLTGCESLFSKTPTGSRGIANEIQIAFGKEKVWKTGVAYLDSLHHWYGSTVDLFNGINREALLESYPDFLNEENIAQMIHYIEINQYLFNNIPSDRYSDKVEATFVGVMNSPEYYEGITVIAFSDDVISTLKEKTDSNKIVEVLVREFNLSSEYFWISGRYVVSCDAVFLSSQKISYDLFNETILGILNDYQMANNEKIQ